MYSAPSEDAEHQLVVPPQNYQLKKTHRKCGIATMLMNASQRAMDEVFASEYVSLHVRKSNHAAFHLYTETLAYEINDIEKGYYADGEDAYDMRKPFKAYKKRMDEEKAAEIAKEVADAREAAEKAANGSADVFAEENPEAVQAATPPPAPVVELD